ncbi:MAG: hypothetical protein K0S09_1149 [Sphingobacteriaceae bacterium]|jgi:hypothetical protein|nr:hypothetical protein [Sphingobacteriaceae bacterium]
MSSLNQDYSTLSEAVEGLQNRGYTYQFDIDNFHLYHKATDERFKPEQLQIIAVYRFEGMSDPDDSVALYAIESNSGHKGILINAYGIYADEQKSAFLKDIPIVEG